MYVVWLKYGEYVETVTTDTKDLSKAKRYKTVAAAIYALQAYVPKGYGIVLEYEEERRKKLI